MSAAFARMDAARNLAEDLRAQLEAARALLQARENNRLGDDPDTKALELTSREAYGFGLQLGFLADQMGKLAEDLEIAMAQMHQKAS